MRLLQGGHEVFGIDQRPNTWTNAFPYKLQDLSARYVNFKGGIGEERYPERIDAVAHLAANAKVHELIEEPWRAFDNIAVTFNVLEYCRQNHLPVIYASSREVYGDIHRYATEESQTHISYTESTYSASKISGEALVYAYARCYGMPYLIFRFSNVYGRYDDDIERMERVTPLFIKKVFRDEPIVVYGKDKTLDFTHVDDCIDGVVRGIERLVSGAVRNETINLAYGEGHTLLELLDYIAKELGKTPRVTVEPAHVGEVTHYVADISKARKLLGYEPRVPLKEGVKKAIAWQREWELGIRSKPENNPKAASHKPITRKILIFSAFFPPFRGGAEVFVEEVGKRLAAAHDVTVLTARLKHSLPKEESVDGMRIIRIGFGIKADKYLYPILAFLKSFTVPHDIVYGVLESYAGIAVALYKVFTWRPAFVEARPAGRPAILNLQSGTLDDWRRGKGFNLLLRRFIHTMPDAIHAISEHLASRARWLGARRVVVIPNGMDLKAHMINVAKDPKKIICVGRLYPVKGQDILIDAMPHVLKEFPNAMLHLIGDGPEKEKLKTQSEKLKISEHVIFCGNLPHSEIPREVASAALFVGPSRREGQGIAFVEAQAAGTAAIGAATGGIPEVIEDGVTGLLVQPENPEALARAMLKLLHDPGYAKQLAVEARKRVLRYDWNRITESVAGLIEETIENKKRARPSLVR